MSRWHVLGEGFTWDTQDREFRDIATAQAGWEITKKMLQNPDIGFVVSIN